MQRKNEEERKSRPLLTELLTDPDEIARREARNALLQFDAVVRLVDEALTAPRSFRLRPSTASDLNRLAIEGINQYPGVYRPHEIEIIGSKHAPPDWRKVPRLVEEMCDYVNHNAGSPPIHLAAYTMWRINWIHPFSDGNGRTARALSYAVLCIRVGYRLPGTNTIPDQIAADKFPYYDALEAADTGFAGGQVDVTKLESLMAKLLAVQLMEVHRQATGAVTP